MKNLNETQYQTAEYVQLDNVYQGIPEVMALGIQAEISEIKDKLSLSSPITDQMRAESKNDRYERINFLDENYYVYQPEYLKIYKQLDSMLRIPYANVNCLGKTAGEIMDNQLAGRKVTMKKFENKNKAVVITGPSGCGKSTLLRRFSEQYPSVLYHPKYEFLQVPIITVLAPVSGSLRDFLLSIVEQYEDILGLPLTDQFKDKGAKTYKIKREVQKLFVNYHTSLLIIDEAQRLNTPNLTRIFHDWFTSFIQDNNLSMVFSGTNISENLLSDCLHLTDRMISGGEYRLLYYTYDPDFKKSVKDEKIDLKTFFKCQKNQNWLNFISEAWDNMVLTNKAQNLTEELINCLYKLSGGCPKVVNTILYKTTQLLTLQEENKPEEITPDLLMYCAETYLKSLETLVVPKGIKPTQKPKKERRKPDRSGKKDLIKPLYNTAKEYGFTDYFSESKLRELIKDFLYSVNTEDKDRKENFVNCIQFLEEASRKEAA